MTSGHPSLDVPPGVRAGSAVRAAELSLLGVAFTFGLTFVLTQQAIERLPVTTFLAYRFLPAAVLVALLCRVELRRLSHAGWRAGLVVGGLLAAGNLFQALSLERTSASTAGLITGLFVVATPLLGWLLLGIATSRGTWIASGLCVAGLALLSGGGDGTPAGSGLALLAALSFGGHILALGTLGRPHAPGPMATLQLAVCGVLLVAVAPLTGGLTVPHGAVEWRAIAVTSLGCGGNRLRGAELGAAPDGAGTRRRHPRRRAGLRRARRVAPRRRPDLAHRLARRGDHARSGLPRRSADRRRTGRAAGPERWRRRPIASGQVRRRPLSPCPRSPPAPSRSARSRRWSAS